MFYNSIGIVICFCTIFTDTSPYFKLPTATEDADRWSDLILIKGLEHKIGDRSQSRISRDIFIDVEDPLLFAIREHNEDLVNKLVQNGANITAADKYGETALHIAAKNGLDKVVELLIQNGADVNALSPSHSTSLHYAAKFGKEKVVELLAKNGVTVDGADENGRTALYFAVDNGSAKIIDTLVQYNTNPNIKDHNGTSPIDLATDKGFTEIVKLLKTDGRVTKRACRVYSNAVSDRILGGVTVKSGEFPWIVALGYLAENNKIISNCSGTILSEYFILSAAHCMRSSRHRPVVVRLGTISLTGDTGFESRQILEIILHPNYSRSEIKNDIALVRVAKRIWFTENIRPACLQTDPSDVDPNVKLTVSGWGLISKKSRNRSDLLLKTDLFTKPLSDCNAIYVEYNKIVHLKTFRNGISESQYCAYDPDGKNDSCDGDSGGPLQIFPYGSKTASLIGIVSFGISCGTGLPSIYTRVAFYVDWIESIVWSTGQV